MSEKEEDAFLASYLGKAAHGGILVVGEIKQALDARLGWKTALASTCNLLHRHNGRKREPDMRHPKNDENAPEACEKTPGAPGYEATGRMQ